MVDEGEQVTLPGCLLLRFELDGRCSDLREYWYVEPGTREPFRFVSTASSALAECSGFKWAQRDIVSSS